MVMTRIPGVHFAYNQVRSLLLDPLIKEAKWVNCYAIKDPLDGGEWIPRDPTFQSDSLSDEGPSIQRPSEYRQCI